MKTLLVTIITFYQNIISPLFKQLFGINKFCRYPLSCSHYAKHVIVTYGVIQGGRMAVHRFFQCQPFTQSKSYASL